MAGTTVDTQAAMAVNPEIDTMLVLPLDPMGRPSPVCSQCKVVTVKAPPTTNATVSFTFMGEGTEGFEGGVRFSVILVDGTIINLDWLSLTIEHEETRSFDLEEDNFSWSNVATVVLELTPG